MERNEASGSPVLSQAFPLKLPGSVRSVRTNRAVAGRAMNAELPFFKEAKDKNRYFTGL